MSMQLVVLGFIRCEYIYSHVNIYKCVEPSLEVAWMHSLSESIGTLKTSNTGKNQSTSNSS